MIEGVTASLLAMGIGTGIEYTCKKFHLTKTLQDDFENAFNQALEAWAASEKPQKKLSRSKYIFQELIEHGYDSKIKENLGTEAKSLLIEFNKAVNDYPKLRSFIQQKLLMDIKKIVEDRENLHYKPESYLHIKKYREITLSLLESQQPEIFYTRKFLYEEIYSEEEREYEGAEIDEKIFLENKILFYGEGGLGKSTYLQKMALLLLENKFNFCFYFDAKQYDFSSLGNLKSSSDKLSNYLYNLAKCFDTEFRELELDTFLLPKENEQYTKYIILDGINEVPTHSERRRILNYLDAIHSKFQVTVICSSRYKDGFNYNSWLKFRTQPISDEELKRIIDKYSSHEFHSFSKKNRSYLKIPFFLDKAVKYDDFFIESYSGFIEKHLLTSIKEKHKKDLILTAMSDIALAAYEEKNISHIAISKIPDYLDYEDLVEKNVIHASDKKEKDSFQFEHQLVADLLVSHKLSKHSDLWNKEIFDIITFESNSSWEVMQMILEQVESEEYGTRFLLNLYNWNYYAVLWCLKFVEKNKYNSRDAVAVILIVAEKLFDRFTHTKESVKKYLFDLFKKFEIKGGIESITTKSYEDFLKLNIGFFKDCDEYENFFHEMIQTDSLDYDTVEKIAIEPNPVKAWGYSNMFKRCNLTQENEVQLKAYFLNADKLVQWRIVHTLGAAKTEHSISFLLDKVELNEYPWVSYGAIRSLIEIYFFSNSHADIIKRLSKENILHKILSNPKLSKELRNCLTYPPENKRISTKQFFKLIIENRVDIFDSHDGEKEQWQKAYKKLKNNGNK